MRLSFIPFIGVLAVNLACSKAPCQHLADSSANLATKASPCAQGDAVTFQTAQVNLNQCGQACSQIDQTSLEQLAGCLDSVPQCDPSNPQAFEAAIAPCSKDVSSISSECEASLVLTTSHGMATTDAGTSSSGGDGCQQLFDAVVSAAAKLAPCNDGGSTMSSFSSAELSACKQQCTSADKAVLSATATCFNGLPECTPTTETAFNQDLFACAGRLQVSPACKQAIGLSGSSP